MGFDFEQLLAKHNQEFRDAPEFGGDWLPPVAKDTYLCAANRLMVGALKDGENCWFKPYLKIIDPASEYYDQEFPLGFFSTETKKIGFLKSLCKKLNGGISVQNRFEARDVLQRFCEKATVINVKVTTTTADNGKEYTNCFIQDIVDIQPLNNNGNFTTPPQGIEGVMNA